MLRLALLLSAACLVSMVLIDRALGPRAEFLNAWSVVERLLGRTPGAGDSMIAGRFGALAEFLAVLVANTAIGSMLAILIRIASRLFR